MTVRDLIILGNSSQQPTRYRNHGAYLFRWNDEGLLFDPGEGTQRQFIFAGIAPTVVTRFFISHFHGDHCLGFGSMLMRLNLDKIQHPIHCYYPASGKKYFDRLRYGTIYRDTIEVIEHPVETAGIVHKDDHFTVEATFLDHGIDNIGWKVTEKDTRKFCAEKLKTFGVCGPRVTELHEKQQIIIDDRLITLDDVSTVRPGESISVVLDTRMCPQAIEIAKNARILLAESTYLESEKELAYNHHHLTAKNAATIAKNACAEQLVLTHFSARYLDLHPFLEEASAVFPNTHIAEEYKQFPFAKKKIS